MRAQCQIEELEGRELDSYDMFMVLGLLKEYDWTTIWSRYGSQVNQPGKINFVLSTENYFVEMTLESLSSLALSAKYQASPVLMQNLIHRILCGHRHNLIVDRLKSYDFPGVDGDQFNLSCSAGTIGVDMVVNHHPQASEYRFRKFGTTRVEQEEQRPLDNFDLVKAINLAPRRTDQVLENYVPQELLNEGTDEEKKVSFSCVLGNGQVDFLFQRISNKVSRQIPPRGNVSAMTLIQTVRRLLAGHSPELLARFLSARGILVTPEEAAQEFTLARIVNDNQIELRFKRD